MNSLRQLINSNIYWFRVSPVNLFAPTSSTSIKLLDGKFKDNFEFKPIEIESKFADEKNFQKFLQNEMQNYFVGNKYNSKSLIFKPFFAQQSDEMSKFVTNNFEVGTIKESKEFLKNCKLDQFPHGLTILLMFQCFDPTRKSLLSNFPIDKMLSLSYVIELIRYSILIQTKVQTQSTDYQFAPYLNKKICALNDNYLLNQIFVYLTKLDSIEITNTIASILNDRFEGIRILNSENTDKVYKLEKLKLEYWTRKNFLLDTSLMAFGCKSALQLTLPNEPQLHETAYEFGRTFGFYLIALQEIEHYKNNPGDYSVDQERVIYSLPAIMRYRGMKNTKNELERAISIAKRYRANAIMDLQSLPLKMWVKDYFKKILNVDL